MLSKSYFRLSLWAAIAALAITLAPPAARAGLTTPATFTIGVLDLPKTLNPLLDPLPASADVTDGIFDSLLNADTHNVLQPDLATRYTVDAKGLRYQFTL